MQSDAAGGIFSRAQKAGSLLSKTTFSTALLGALVATTVAASSAEAQALPTPFDYASSLDLECYRTPGPALNLNLVLGHLNPVLRAAGLPQHNVVVRELAQTCVPVRKNNSGPIGGSPPFVANTDFACYRLEAAALPNPFPLNLTHLNPVLQNFPPHNVRLVRPAQLCVPVYKNNNLPSAQIQQLVRFLDLECWQTDPDPHPVFQLLLTQLNPLLVNLIPPHSMTLVPQPRQLCVPVRKNNQQIPEASLKIIEWVDAEKFFASPSVNIAPVNITLRHLNPLFANLAPVPVTLQEANGLMVPVAKNGQLPPKD